MKKFSSTLSFDDVLLTPLYSDIPSRKEIDISSELSGVGPISSPIIASPMDTVTEVEMAVAMAECGGIGVVHRYNTIDEQAKIAQAIKIKTDKVAVAIGVSGDFLERANAVVAAGAKILCVDVAHGHHALMKKALFELKRAFGDDVHLMAGNVATLSAFNDLSDWGADSIRVGIGGGSICSTRIQTGHGVPTFQSILDCSATDRPAKIIADGGIKNSGDACKALAAGADFVMLGSMLSGTDQAPGRVLEKNGQKFKAYRGMASREAQKSWRDKVSSVEGISTVVPYKGSAYEKIRDIEWGIKSGLSYSGARNLSEFRSKREFIIQTTSGQVESSTHIARQFSS